MATSTFKLYSIEGIDYDAVIDKYRQMCNEGIKEIDPNSLSVYSNTELRYNIIHKSRKPTDTDYKIVFKAKYLIHTIAYRQATNLEENTRGISIKSEILKGVIGKDYYEILRAFETLGYIKIYPDYIVGERAKRYEVLRNIVVTECGYNKAIEYINDTKERLLKDTQDAVDERYGVEFRKIYTKSLRRFKIKDKVGFNKFIDRKRKPAKVHYYNFIRDCFNDRLNIISIDYNNRIYQVLTSMKRELKQYLNIKFSIDCKNSHPLLFNYFIFNNKNVSLDLSYKISNILYLSSYNDNIEYHYVVKNLRKALSDNNIDASIIEKFADDELLYLWKTTTGRFWDDIVEENEHKYQRSVIKKRMFAQVFYAKTEKDAMFAAQFKRDYPNVYNLILQWKTPLKYANLSEYLVQHKMAMKAGDGVVVTQNQETSLPNLMMRLESSIFYEILTRLYSNSISAVHIHDAIVVPDTETDIEAHKIEEVMRAAYRKYGLHPTFSVDKYGE